MPYLQTQKKNFRFEERIARRLIISFLGHKYINAITVKDIERWLGNLKNQNYTANSRNRYYMVLRSIFNCAHDQNLIDDPPTNHIKAEKIVSRIIPNIDLKLISRLFEQLNNINDLEAKALLLIAYTKVRKGIILALRWENINLSEHYFIVTDHKCNKNIKVALSDESMTILKPLFQARAGDYIFPSKIKKRHLSDLFIYWKNVRSRFGMDFIRIRDLSELYSRLHSDDDIYRENSINNNMRYLMNKKDTKLNDNTLSECV